MEDKFLEAFKSLKINKAPGFDKIDVSVINQIYNQKKRKRNVISSIANLVYELPHEFLNNLKLKILGNKAILEKSQIWVETVVIPKMKL